MCINHSFACVCFCVPCACLMTAVVRRGRLHPLELELWMAVRHQVDFGNPTWFLCKSCKDSTSDISLTHSDILKATGFRTV